MPSPASGRGRTYDRRGREGPAYKLGSFNPFCFAQSIASG
jgi:hypothetical protein